MGAKMGWWIFLVTFSIFAGTSSAAWAKKGGGEAPAGWSKGEKKGWEGESQPPGWSKGEKKGWKDKAMPWGWFKKESQPAGDPLEKKSEKKKGKKDKEKGGAS